MSWRSGDRIEVGGRFSAPVQTSPGPHPAPCTMGTEFFQEVKRQGRGADHPNPSKRRGHERVGLYLYSTSGSQWPVIGWNLTLPLFCMLVTIRRHANCEDINLSRISGFEIFRVCSEDSCWVLNWKGLETQTELRSVYNTSWKKVLLGINCKFRASENGLCVCL